MSPKMSEKELFELFGAFLQEAEIGGDEPKVAELKASLRKKLGDFPARFANGAIELLKSTEATTTPQ